MKRRLSKSKLFTLVTASIFGVLCPKSALAGTSIYPTMVHPGFKMDTVPKLGGLATMGIGFLSTGDMILVTAETSGSPNGTDWGGGAVPVPSTDAAVWFVGDTLGVLSKPRKIADMFKQPMGVGIGPNDEIMIPDRDSVYKIPSLHPTNTSTNKNGVLPLPVKDDWHHWIFTPVYSNGNYLAPYSGSMVQGGYNTTNPTSEYSGAMLSWTSNGAGGFKKYAGGLRSPNGAALGANGVILMSDNQGSYEPSCPINIVKPNVFYGYAQGHAGNFQPNWAEAANKAGTLPYQPPVAWLLYNTVGVSTSQPAYMSKGPYTGDWIFGDVNAQGITRLTLDPVNGGTGATANYNSSVTFFTGGLGDAAPNRIMMDPNQNALLIGTLGVTWNWPRPILQSFYKLTFVDSVVAKTFEILSVKSRAQGVEIIFSGAVDPTTALAGSFSIHQWHMNRQDGYGYGNDGIGSPNISAVQFSEDHKRVFLKVGNVAGFDTLMEIAIDGIKSATGNKPLLFNKVWFTHNYQSTVAFNTATTSTLNPIDHFFDEKISHTILNGAISVKVNLPGDYTLSLHRLNGAEVVRKKGSGAGDFNFHAPIQGLYLLQVTQGNHHFMRPVAL